MRKVGGSHAEAKNNFGANGGRMRKAGGSYAEAKDEITKFRR